MGDMTSEDDRDRDLRLAFSRRTQSTRPGTGPSGHTHRPATPTEWASSSYDADGSSLNLNAASVADSGRDSAETGAEDADDSSVGTDTDYDSLMDFNDNRTESSRSLFTTPTSEGSMRSESPAPSVFSFHSSRM